MTQLSFAENVGPSHLRGELEFIFKDKNGRVISRAVEQNLVKIFAKEILSHRMPHSRVWDPEAGTGSGDWVEHGLDFEEFAPKYIVFGASFDETGQSLDSADTRYYVQDPAIGGFRPITLSTGADYEGGLINAIPISEPTRPLKRVERIFFQPTYQPAGTPILQDNVRAINNIVVLETTLRQNEYNGFGVTTNDFFTITEIALVGAKEVGNVGACELDPRDIFLTGNESENAFAASASGTATISLDPSETLVDEIREGDQIKIITGQTDPVEQVNPFYLVINKFEGGRDIVLDRVPVDVDGDPIVGPIEILRDGFRIFSHRILKNPVKKSEDFEIVVRWSIIFN